MRAQVAIASIALVLWSGCALSHEIGGGDPDDPSSDDGSRFDGGFAAADGGRGDSGRADAGGRDLGPVEREDLGTGDEAADPEAFEDEVDRYVRLERRARESWCPCFADRLDVSVEECLETMFRPRECIADAIAGAPKNDDLVALRCFNAAAERVYFPCVDALSDCGGRDACEEAFVPAVEACATTDLVDRCFTFSR